MGRGNYVYGVPDKHRCYHPIFVGGSTYELKLKLRFMSEGIGNEHIFA